MPRFLNGDFAHTHVHSEYSKFDGLAKIAKLVMKARQMGFPAIALTDHGTVGGWIKLIAECERKKDREGNELLCKDAGGREVPLPTIKPVIGCEFYLARDHKVHEIARQPDGRKGNRHIVLHAKNWKGYQNICRLSEKSWLDGFYHSPRIDIELLAAHSEGVMCQSACLSSVINASLLADKYDEAKRAATIFKNIFGEDFALEVLYHGIDAEAAIIPDVLKLGAQLGVPVMATNDVHYIEKPQAKSQEILMCMSTNKCVLDPKHLHFPFDAFYLKSAQEMGDIFGHHPSLLYNTAAWAERVDIKNIKDNMGGMRLPPFPVPPEFKSPHEYMEHLAWEGMTRLNWQASTPHVEALRKEIEDIRIAKVNNDYDFATYLLMKWDMIASAKEKNIYTGCGRGSGYASVLLRALGITYGPDPLRYGLLWERFLGFDNKRYVKESDFGITVKPEAVVSSIAEILDEAQEAAQEKAEENNTGDEAEEEEEFVAI